MTVRRTLPQRQRSLIGAWCFVDHYGPDPVDDTGGMNVAPHPHTGLQTVSWLFEGEIEHRDSAGNHAMVRPGQVNLMTAGRGISHSEVSTPGTRTLHGAQLWVALPDADRHADPGFAHHEPSQLTGRLVGAGVPGVAARRHVAGVDVHTAAGRRDPARPRHPALPRRRPGVRARRARRLRAGQRRGHRAKPSDLAYVPTGSERLELRSYDEPTRLLLLGGPPFGEPIVMWWNFVGRNHEEIVGFREEWQAQIVDGALPTVASASRWETCCRRSRLPCCRTLDSGNGASSRRPAPSVQVEPGSTGAPVLAGAVWVPGT